MCFMDHELDWRVICDLGASVCWAFVRYLHVHSMSLHTMSCKGTRRIWRIWSIWQQLTQANACTMIVRLITIDRENLRGSKRNRSGLEIAGMDGSHLPSNNRGCRPQKIRIALYTPTYSNLKLLRPMRFDYQVTNDKQLYYYS